MSQLVQQCQKALNNISTHHTVRFFWVSGHSVICGNEISNGITVHQFVGLEPAFRFPRQITRRKIKRWTDNQHMAIWQGLTSTQRQAHKLISSPSPTAKTRLLPFNGTHSRVVTSLLTGYNTLRRHLYIMGLIDSPLCRCGMRTKPQLTFCVSVKPWRHSDIPIWVPFSWTLTMLEV